jgi:DNA invertase Pin-like site-specific DNA recombinase
LKEGETMAKKGATKQAEAVVYLRVSTQKQGADGLGIEAQRASVAKHCETHGLALVAEFVEVESGANPDRPELARALALCRRTHATLVISSLSRLSRNVAALAALLDGNGFELAVADLPGANRFLLHIMAAVAEQERTQVSERTKAAMAAAKARGQRFGSPRPEIGSKAGVRALKAKAAKHARNVAPLITELRHTRPGISAAAIARELQARGVPTGGSGAWAAGAVLNVERRAARLRG